MNVYADMNLNDLLIFIRKLLIITVCIFYLLNTVMLINYISARHLHYRFTDNYIAQLMEMQWWDWPLDVIKQKLTLICSKDISAFYHK